MAHIQVWTQPRHPLSKRKLYHWHVRASNGRVLCVGDNGYNNLGDLWHGVSEIAKALNIGLQNTLPVHDSKPDK